METKECNTATEGQESYTILIHIVGKYTVSLRKRRGWVPVLTQLATSVGPIPPSPLDCVRLHQQPAVHSGSPSRSQTG